MGRLDSTLMLGIIHVPPNGILISNSWGFAVNAAEHDHRTLMSYFESNEFHMLVSFHVLIFWDHSFNPD